MYQMIPPSEINYSGDGDFVAIGKEFVQHFVNYGSLQPYERVLDVGSGVGRMAIPLTQYMNEHGLYDGIDVVPLGIKWCQQHITPRFPNFKFHVADVRNSAYNPGGRMSAEGFRFPFDDRSFDFVFLTSVFTHMTPAATENYIAEIARVLKQDGRVFATLLLLNDEVEQMIDEGMSPLLLPYRFEVHWVEDYQREECIVAMKESAVEEMLTRYGFAATRIHRGHWCGREHNDLYEDIVVARKAKDVEIPLHLRKQRLRAVYHPKNILRRVFGRRQPPDIDPKTKQWYLPKAG